MSNGKDRYPSMTELLRLLPPEGNFTFFVERGFRSPIKIFAPHGGCIEPCTSPIALALAQGAYDCFVFNGVRKSECFKTLHVTSTRYDEPRCLEMAREALLNISVHGCDGNDPFLHVGGGNRALAANLGEHLRGKGYAVRDAASSLLGRDERNFINLGREKGIQLELSAGFRKFLFPSFPGSLQKHPVHFGAFIGAMRSWMGETAARELNPPPA